MSDGRPLEEPAPPAVRWLRLADEDLTAARTLLDSGSAVRRIVCFLAQQGAEKALKAGLFAVGQTFPRIHGLTELHARFPDDSRPIIDADDLDLLDPWVLDGRYAADLPDVSREYATRALAVAQRVVETIRPLVRERD